MSDSHAITELTLFIDNDGELYKRKKAFESRVRQLLLSGKYNHNKGVFLWEHFVKEGLRKYNKEIGPLKMIRGDLIRIALEYRDACYKELNEKGIGPHSSPKGKAILEATTKQASKLQDIQRKVSGLQMKGKSAESAIRQGASAAKRLDELKHKAVWKLNISPSTVDDARDAGFN